MMNAPIHFLNRYTGEVEEESVYGGEFLRFAYGNPLGRLTLHALIKRALFSRWYGWRMNRPASRERVQPFIAKYGLDPAEFETAPDGFGTFNEFFYRKLKPSARPVDPDPDAAVFPADGRHFGFPDVSLIEGVFVKGEVLDLKALLGDDDLANQYARGSIVLSRLCPVDYHRFHFPVGGKVSEPILLNGPLYSVNPIALRRNIQILARNRRWLSRVDSAIFGTVLTLEIGATCVGATRYTVPGGAAVAKGDEKGYFLFGGSSMVTLFEPGRVRLAEDLTGASGRGMELYARFGDRMAQRLSG